MLIDAKDRFVDRMAMTIASVKFDETAAGFAARFSGHDPRDVASARTRSKNYDNQRVGPKGEQ